MALRRTEAWLIGAVNDEDVESAMVLAESIRRTKTTRTITAITARNVPLGKRMALTKAFDAVFCMDESSILGSDEFQGDRQVAAKLHAFSLFFLEKCIYLSPNSLMLENCDRLFEDHSGFMALRRSSDTGNTLDLSLFKIEPCRDLWEPLWESARRNAKNLSEDFLGNWLSNQSGAVKMGYFSAEKMAKLNLTDGCLMSEHLQPPLIQIQMETPNCANLHERMMNLYKSDTGLREKFISSAWLQIFNERTCKILNNPSSTTTNISRGASEIFKNEPIAIIGMSCRYPGANNLQEFWNLLYQGEEGVRPPPAFRWTKEHSLRVSPLERKTNAGFLSTTVDEFDARFFGVSPKEAAYMDPQARLLHEVMWESLENSGIDPLSLYGTHTGIFTGSWMNDYKDIVQGSTERDFFRTYMGNSIGAAAARLSFLLGLTGPSIATESGCSSAIVAVDLAVKSLRCGETNLAVTGGVNLLLHPFTSNIMDYVIAPDGRCKTFDVNADGFGRAEGCGVLVLKRMSDALRDRDNIWALIRGSAVSQEGLSRSLGTPTVHCEALAMQLALRDANVNPEDVLFVETHGTGTSVGDPMEVAAINKAYYSPNRKSPLIIGSVKTNVGHTESCSGITGIMKTILAMQNELIPKHRNLESLNPEIFLDSIPAMIPTEPVPWPKVKGHPRLAGVSSFGITGTDGHVIVQEAPDYEFPKTNLQLERPAHIFKFSGKTKDALQQILKDHQNTFEERVNDDDFFNAAFSSNVGRASFNHRAFIVAGSYQDAAKALSTNKQIEGELVEGENSQICFLFTGQGSQYHGMARTLYDTSPVFRVNFDMCDRLLRHKYNLSIREILWESDPATAEIGRTIYSQTSIFCVEFCLLKLWESWGIKPDYVLGHSLGEFAAAVAVGALEFKDAIKLVAERSRLIDALPRGSMLVVKASQPEVGKLMKDAELELDFAAVNQPEQTVVAGDTNTVNEFLAFTKAQGLKAIILDATHAFHSRHMNPMLAEYRKVAQGINYNTKSSSIQYVSGMEGRILEDQSEINAEYWVRHTREKVSFIDACTALKESGCTTFIEVGPQPVLSSFVMMNNENASLNCFPSLRRGADDWQIILESLGKLYLSGFAIDWNNFDAPYVRKKVSLPFHPFNRKSFWVEITGGTAPIIHPLVGYPMNNASTVHIFQNDLSLKSVPYVKDHCIGSRIIFPGAGFTEMSLSAGYCVAHALSESFDTPTRAMRLENLRIDAPLELKEEKSCRLQVVVDLPQSSEPSQGEQGFRVKVFHQNVSNEETGKWVLHASSTYVPVASTKDSMTGWDASRIQNIMNINEAVTPESFYKRVDDAGLKFGESFRMIKRFWNQTPTKVDSKANMDEVVIEMEIPSDANKYLLHPLIIDAAFQSGFLTKYQSDGQDTKLRVPVRIGQLTLFKGIDVAEKSENKKLYIHSWCEKGQYAALIATSTFEPIALLEDVEMLDTTVRTIESVLEQQSSSVPDAWEEVWKVIPSPFTSSVKSIPMESLFNNPEFIKTVKEYGKTAPEDVEIFKKTQKLLYMFILNALQELGWSPTLNSKIAPKELCAQLSILPQHEQLVRFYLAVFEKYAGILSQNGESWQVKELPPCNEIVKQEASRLFGELKNSSHHVVIGIYEYIAQRLSKILSGSESALSLLFPTDESMQEYSAESYYYNQPGRKSMEDIVGVTCRSIFKETEAANSQDTGKVYRVLEVGSGTGSLSHYLLGWLKERWGDRFEFYYTDISQTFFIKAEAKLQEFSQNIKFAVFNIEESPLTQGIPTNYFDMVAATDVLHATRDLSECLFHLRQTLKPGGLLCFKETVIQSTDITFVFGLLEGYWRFQDFSWRPHHSCVNEETWDSLIRQCGFDSVHVSKAHVDQFAWISAVASPTIPLTQMSPSTKDVDMQSEWVVFGDIQNIKVTESLANTLEVCGNRVTVVLEKMVGGMKLRENVTVKAFDSDDVSGVETVLKRKDTLKGVIYAWGMDTCNMEAKKIALPFLNVARNLLQERKPPPLYVLTKGAHSVHDDSIVANPTAATLFGMAKSVKNENVDMFVRYVDLDQASSPEQLIDQVLFELAMRKGVKEFQRVQVVYRDCIRYEPRFIKSSLKRRGDELKLPPSSERYQLVLPKSRVIQDLEFGTLDFEGVGDSEMEIKVKAFALNFRDILTVIKPSAAFENMNAVGLDFSGVVTKTGKMSEFKVGDRVFGVVQKDYQLPSHVVVDSAVRIPDTMTFWEAATLPAVFSTAYYSLITIAKMKKGDTVLIHTGSGGVGLAAIQLIKHVGATVITTAGNPRKRAYLRSLGVQHVFHSRNTSYEQDIMRVTQGRGVDIVLNSITGPGFKEATLKASAKNARFIEMSKLSVWSVEEVKAMRPDVDYTIVDLTSIKAEEWKCLLGQLQEYLKKGFASPLPYVKFDALNIRQALQYFQKAKHIGKVVCTMPDVTIENGQYQVSVPLFSAESSYLITGGLGGIGFEVCKWMLRLGAVNIVLTGRNPPNPETLGQIEDLNGKGYNVQVKLGNIGNYDRCKTIVDEMCKDGKPLRGVMHCAGVLRDNLYANQTWESFQDTFTPKVDGTWNLHRATAGHNLEHFVVYSSITALMGTTSQPNHAAANCFEDSFIHYRHSQGLPGTTINYGQWAQVGCAKEIALTGVNPVSVSRMLNGLELALKSQTRQICLCDFESFLNLSMLCPMTKGYIDERLWKQYVTSSQASLGLQADQFWKEFDEKPTKSEKVSLLGSYLKVILRTALRLEPDEPISDDANIQELGVDSLMMLELKNSIQSLLGSRVNVTASILKNCNTVRLIADALVCKALEDDGMEDELILEPLPGDALLELLNSDKILDPSIKPKSSACPPSRVKSVLVTGANGTLAPFLISELFRSYPKVEKIVCLLRGDDDKTVTEKFKTQMDSLGLTIEQAKVVCVAGDVAKDNLGMPASIYTELCSCVDAVLHCAAKSHNSEPYRMYENGSFKDIRSVNVRGTLNILKFAVESKTKHVYYPSNFLSAVLMESEDGTLSDSWPYDNILETVVHNHFPGLQAAKFVSEMLLHQASERGVPCKVFRFPWIAGESKTGRSNFLQNMYILRFLSFLKLKAMHSLVIPANFLPVDICARISLQLFLNDDAPYEVFNVGHPQPQVEQDFCKLAQEEYGVSLETMEWPAFVQRLEETDTSIVSLRDLYKDQRMLSGYMGEAAGFVKGYLVSPDTFFINKKVSKFIPNYGMGIDSSMDILRRDLEYVKQQGFFNKLGL